METATTTTATAAIFSPLWLQNLNPYMQAVVCALGGVWLCVQIYYKIKNKGR